MFYDSFPSESREARETREAIIFKAEIAVEDESRRQCTTFGYKHGGSLTMVLWMYKTVGVAFFAVIALFVLAPMIDPFVSVILLFWMIVLLAAIVMSALLPFLFLKVRLALKTTAVVIALWVTWGAVSASLFLAVKTVSG